MDRHHCAMGMWGIVLSAFLVSPGVTPGQDGRTLKLDRDQYEASSLSEILAAIQTQESAQDAKCQATATRLENFICGTALTDEARFEKIKLQKALILDLWKRASAEAEGEGVGEVTPVQLQPLLDSILVATALEDGRTRIELSEGPSITLDRNDARHYSSVAYSLRAILAVQQDQLWDLETRLRPLSPDAIAALRERLDLLTLAALDVADRDARRDHERHIRAAALTQAWRQVAPKWKPFAPATASRPPASGPQVANPRTRELPILRAIVEKKIAAYEAYNEIQREEEQELFERNITHFFARYSMAQGRETAKVHQEFQTAVQEFIRQALEGAQHHAGQSAHPLIRADDAMWAIQVLTPHEVDDLEDATFFPNLPRERRIKLEAYDMDAFRDFGLHWKLIKQVLDSGQCPLRSELDPFAAEIIAEGATQYGVLLFRVAGDIAKEEELYATIKHHHIERAYELIAKMTRRHHATPPREEPPQTLVSAAGGGDGESLEPYMTQITQAVGLDYTHRSSDWLSRFRRSLEILPPTFSGGGHRRRRRQ